MPIRLDADTSGPRYFMMPIRFDSRYVWMPIRLVWINVDPIHFDPIHFVYEISLVLQSVVQLPNILGNACQKQRYVQYKTASKQKK